MIAANDISTSDAGFEVDTNRVVLLSLTARHRSSDCKRIRSGAVLLNKAASWFEKV
jgi:hypothetical protein